MKEQTQHKPHLQLKFLHQTKSDIYYCTIFNSYTSFGQYTASNQPTTIVEDETTKSENSSRQFILREHIVGQDAIDVLKLAGSGFLKQLPLRIQ